MFVFDGEKDKGDKKVRDARKTEQEYAGESGCFQQGRGEGNETG